MDLMSRSGRANNEKNTENKALNSSLQQHLTICIALNIKRSIKKKRFTDSLSEI